jgi:hypothetical protein
VQQVSLRDSYLWVTCKVVSEKAQVNKYNQTGVFSDSVHNLLGESMLIVTAYSFQTK